MNQAANRALTGQLADDLAWLEEHARSQPSEAEQAGALRLAAALLRNVVAPFLEGQPPLPLHIAVVGGAGAGKSTVANFLMGTLQAESNPQAGFTRHPVAYVKQDGQLAWPALAGFLGPLQKLTRTESSSLDEDVYQVRRLASDGDAGVLLDRFVIWDCPDMTTWAAANYVPRLIEVAGLADIVVYVASDERYNDEVPTQFLKLLLEAGKAVVVCLIKMKEADVAAFLEHFNSAVLKGLPGAPVARLAIPHLTREQLAARSGSRRNGASRSSTRWRSWGSRPPPPGSERCKRRRRFSSTARPICLMSPAKTSTPWKAGVAWSATARSSSTTAIAANSSPPNDCAASTKLWSACWSCSKSPASASTWPTPCT
jgi:hypothetical protein